MVNIFKLTFTARLVIFLMIFALGLGAKEAFNQVASVALELSNYDLTDIKIKGYVEVTIESGDTFEILVSPYLAQKAKIKQKRHLLEISYDVSSEQKYQEAEQIRIILPVNQVKEELSISLGRKNTFLGLGPFPFTSSLTLHDGSIKNFKLTYSDNQKIVIANSTIKNLELKGSGNGSLDLYDITGVSATIYNSGKQKLSLKNLTFLDLNYKSSGNGQTIISKSQIKNMIIDNSGSQAVELEATPIHFLQVKSSGSSHFTTKNSPIKNIDLKSSGSFKGNFNLDNNASHTIKSSGSMRLVIENDCRINLNNSGSLVINEQRYRDFKGRLAIVV